MEKWKGVVVVLIIVALGGYGYFASRPPAPDQKPPKPPDSEQAFKKVVGHQVPSWQSIPDSLWVNFKGEREVRGVRMSDIKGHVTLLEFWRATCPHCKAAAPFMEKLYKKYKDKGLMIIGIQSPSDNPDPHFVENDWGQVRSVVDQWGITYPVAFDEHAQLFKNTFHGTLYPTLYMIDPNGKVIDAEAGYTEKKAKTLEHKVRAALKKYHDELKLPKKSKKKKKNAAAKKGAKAAAKAAGQ